MGEETKGWAGERRIGGGEGRITGAFFGAGPEARGVTSSPGNHRERTPMFDRKSDSERVLTLAGVIATSGLLALAACGGGGGGSATTSTMDPGGQDPGPGGGPVITLGELTLPLARASSARQQPVIRFDDELRIGGMPPPLSAGLAPVATHGDAAVSRGTVRDGVGGATLIDYLQRDATDRQTRPGTVFAFEEAPTVRYVAGTTPGEVDEIVRAVQLINANLPPDFQIPVDATAFSAADDAAGLDELADGEIVIEYDRREDWEISYTAGPDQAGLAQTRRAGSVSLAARVWVDDTRVSGDERMTTLVHEILHALGRFHPDPARFPDTVMNAPSTGVEGYVLHPLDGQALLAVYGTLEAGDTPADIAADLGPWDDQSMHVRADLGDLAFGASVRDGHVRPWAFGPRPGIDLADNPRLTGSASWDGRLLGLTPSGGTVAGGAGLTIDLDTLRGDLEFTGLESWTGAPGLVGTGATWGDGDLEYLIGIRGNLFGRIGGDEGRITGAFFGAGHEGMAGTLTRDDLAAGFAGSR